ncbi:hypothetical protein [Kamptonema sp. PCC 6506]|uniref:hypothetical protein n=1 Tax=Kamptonema sp. PCC 6506 TaxID=272129 RepID=UPI0015652389|nr:hypothetical protein [Kamptonema sp. PCC 6506]
MPLKDGLAILARELICTNPGVLSKEAKPAIPTKLANFFNKFVRCSTFIVFSSFKFSTKLRSQSFSLALSTLCR